MNTQPGFRLTNSEIEVLDFLAQNGKNHVAIGDALGKSPLTVRNQVQGAAEKLNINGRHRLLTIMRYWRCELYQIGLKELGLRQ